MTLESAFRIACLLALICAMPTNSEASGKWSGVAYCKKTGNLGYSYRQVDQQAADVVAKRACRNAAVQREGMSDGDANRCCASVFQSKTACLVIAASGDSRKNHAATGPNAARAIQRAMANCMRSGQFCRPVVISCGGGRKGAAESNADAGWGVAKAIPGWELR